MPNTRQILIVDDDPELRDALSEQLSLYEEFEAVAAEDGSKGVQAAKAGQIDLVIMDVGLPDIDGHEAVRILRRNGFKAPIIMLTGRNTDSDTILGLESGANDYVTKPFRFAVLLARIRAQLRQHETSDDAIFTIGPYTFRPSLKLLLNPKGSRSGATTRESPRTGSRRTSIDYGKRLRRMPPLRPSWSLKRAPTNWCLDRGRHDDRRTLRYPS
jgi:DNA-binding response OmpR family regulator